MCKHGLDIKGIHKDVVDGLFAKNGTVIVVKDENTVLYTDGYILYQIPRDKWFIDDSQCGRVSMDNVKYLRKMVDGIKDCKPVNIVGTYEKTMSLSTQKGIVVEFDDGTWINKKYLKRFPTDAIYSRNSNSPYNPIFVIDNESKQPMGLILPVRH